MATNYTAYRATLKNLDLFGFEQSNSRILARIIISSLTTQARVKRERLKKKKV